MADDLSSAIAAREAWGSSGRYEFRGSHVTPAMTQSGRGLPLSVCAQSAGARN